MGLAVLWGVFSILVLLRKQESMLQTLHRVLWAPAFAGALGGEGAQNYPKARFSRDTWPVLPVLPARAALPLAPHRRLRYLCPPRRAGPGGVEGRRVSR